MGCTRNKGRQRACAVLAVAILAGTGACGKKAAPFLPVPLTAKELSVREILVRKGDVTVTFRVPSEVFSFAGEEERWGRAELLRRAAGESEFSLVTEAAPDEGYGFGDRAAVTDADVSPGAAYQYRLELRKTASKEWAAAGPFEVTLAHIQAVVDPPRIDGREEALAVSWDKSPAAPEGTVWLLSRRQKGAGEPAPVSPAPLGALSYVDTRVAPGRTYCYTVIPVITEGLVVMEGAPSPEACGTTVDRTPPPSPTDLIAVVEEGGVRLSWLPSRAGDVVEHRVYRAVEGGPFVLLATTPPDGARYLDATATPGGTYSYRVSAVDHPPARNESPFSSSVRVVFTGR